MGSGCRRPYTAVRSRPEVVSRRAPLNPSACFRAFGIPPDRRQTREVRGRRLRRTPAPPFSSRPLGCPPGALLRGNACLVLVGAGVRRVAARLAVDVGGGRVRRVAVL